MNIEATKAKLKKLSNKDLNTLYNLVLEEKADNRMQFTSNTTHTPNEQYKSLSEALHNAWIHGH